MTSKVKPVLFVKGKTDHSVEQQEIERVHKRQSERDEEKAGQQAKEFYECIIAESASSHERTLEAKGDDSYTCRRKRARRKLSHSELGPSATTAAASFEGTQKVNKLNELLRYCQEGNHAEVKRLLRNGDACLGDSDQFGWNALMCAAYSGHSRLVAYLIQREPSLVRHRNQQGQSAAVLAHMAGHESIAEYLLQTEQDGLELRKETDKKMSGTSSVNQDPVWCDTCQANFKEAAKMHHQSTAHLFSCGHAPRPTHYHLPESNRGFQMMLQDGWDKEKGLGKGGEGNKFPVKTILKRDRQGLGAGADGGEVRPRVTHFKPFDTDAVKRPRKEHERKKTNGASEDLTKRSTESRQSERHKHKAMEIDFRMSFHSQP